MSRRHEESRRVRVGPRTLVIRAARGVHALDRFVGAAVRALPVRAGEAVLDLGCGTGVYGCAAAALGAGEVWMTDIDPGAVECARANARANAMPRIECRVGDLFAPCRGRRFDVIIGNLPQTPGPRAFLPAKWGGKDGTLHLRRFLREAPRHLRPRGRLFFVIHDLCDSRRIETIVRRRFRLRTVLTLRRPFTSAEYDGYLPGLFDYLVELRRRGVARFGGRGDRRWFRLRAVVATIRQAGPRSAQRGV